MILSKPGHIKIYGHRGASGNYPENTLESFKYLFDNNISAYETDILISKDQVPVIFHDFRLKPNINRTNKDKLINGDIKIFDQTFNELSKFDIGSISKRSKTKKQFFNKKKLKNHKIPKLTELLELTSKNLSDNLLINLEIKSTPIEKNLTPNPDEMVKLIMDDICKFEFDDKIIISSFDWRILSQIKKFYPKISRAYLTSEEKDKIYDKSPWLNFTPLYDNNINNLPTIVKKLGGKAWHPNYIDINEDIVRISHELALPVNVWTVNEEFEMLRMIDYGVNGIITDYPLMLKELCERRNIKWY